MNVNFKRYNLCRGRNVWGERGERTGHIFGKVNTKTISVVWGKINS